MAVPEDRFQFTYFVFLLLGCGTLLSWNVFITEKPYFEVRVASEPTLPGLASNFESAIVLVFNCANIVALLVLMRVQAKLPPRMQVLPPLVIALTVMAVNTALPWDYSLSGSTVIGFTLPCVALLGAATAMLSGGVYIAAAHFPPLYIQAVMTGQAVAGLGVAIAAFLTTFLAAPDKGEGPPRPPAAEDLAPAAFLFFGSATTVMSACIAGYLALPHLPFARHWLTKGQDSSTRDIEAKIGGLEQPLLPSKPGYLPMDDPEQSAAPCLISAPRHGGDAFTAAADPVSSDVDSTGGGDIISPSVPAPVCTLAGMHVVRRGGRADVEAVGIGAAPAFVAFSPHPNGHGFPSDGLPWHQLGQAGSNGPHAAGARTPMQHLAPAHGDARIDTPMRSLRACRASDSPDPSPSDARAVGPHAAGPSPHRHAERVLGSLAAGSSPRRHGEGDSGWQAAGASPLGHEGRAAAHAAVHRLVQPSPAGGDRRTDRAAVGVPSLLSTSLMDEGAGVGPHDHDMRSVPCDRASWGAGPGSQAAPLCLRREEGGSDPPSRVATPRESGSHDGIAKGPCGRRSGCDSPQGGPANPDSPDNPDGEPDALDVLNDGEGDSAAPHEPWSTVQLLRVLAPSCLSVIGCFAVTLSAFPGLVAAVCSVHDDATSAPCGTTAAGAGVPFRARLSGDLWVPLLFVVFNAGDLGGRLLAGLRQSPWAYAPPCNRTLAIYTAGRAALVGAVCCCHVLMPAGMAWRVPGMLARGGDSTVLALILALGITNGHLASTVLMHVPRSVPRAERDRAGVLLTLCITVGLFLGSNAGLGLIAGLQRSTV